MVLTTHAVAGAAVATLVPSHPVLGFALGFGSHFVLDSVPHWEYPVFSMKGGKSPLDNDMLINKAFVGDLIRIGIDGMLGITLALFFLGTIYHHSFFIIILGAIAGMLPDALQFVYFKWRHEPLVSLQKFHIWVHPKLSLHNKPFIGVLSQIVFIFLIIFVLK